MTRRSAEVTSLEKRRQTLQTTGLRTVEPAPAREFLPSRGEYGLDLPRGRHSRGRRLVLLSFCLAVILPTFAALGFTTFYASNQFVSEFRVAVRSLEPIKTGGMADLFGFAGVTQAGNDSNAVVQYLQSRQAIDDLDGGAAAARGLYDDTSIDWFSRLRADAPIEEFTRYWDRMVDSYYEPQTGTIIVKVGAFKSTDAFRLATDLWRNAEGLVNRLSERARQDTVAFAAQEVARAEARLAEVRAKAKVLQDKESILDPQASAEATLTLAAKLKEEIAKRNAELTAQRARLAANAPSVLATEDGIGGLQRELERVEAQATAARSRARADEKPLSSVLGAFQQLGDEKTFAEKAYASALTSLETARMDAARQQLYLATIVPPAMPEEASFPKPPRDVAIVFGVATAVWLIGLLAVYSVREHM
jgi:capsular polysaccharide transport system permease protein